MTVVSLAEMLDQRAQVVERGVVHLAGAQIEQMEMLPDLEQELAGARLVTGVLKGADDLFHAARDGRPGVMAEAANLQAWRVALRQAGEITAQAVGQREGSGMVADDQFAPGVERQLVDAQHQVLAGSRITERIGPFVRCRQVPSAERVEADVDQQQCLPGNAAGQQRLLGGLFQRHGEGLAQRIEQREQLGLAEAAIARVQRQVRGRIDDAVAMTPGEQREQFTGALDGRMVRGVRKAQAARVQRPGRFAGGIEGMHQRQAVFGHVRRDAQVDQLDLAGLALDGGAEEAPDHREVAPVDRAGGLQAARQLTEKTIAVGQFVDQRPPLAIDLADLPAGAPVEQGELALVPAPIAGQAFQQLALPAFLTVSRRLAERFVDLQVEAVSQQC